MNNDNLDYAKLKTIIYSPSGYYGSECLWNDASYAFRHRHQQQFYNKNLGLTQGIDSVDKWQYLTNNRHYLAEKLDVDIDILPEYDYEFCVIEKGMGQ